LDSLDKNIELHQIYTFAPLHQNFQNFLLFHFLGLTFKFLV